MSPLDTLSAELTQIAREVDAEVGVRVARADREPQPRVGDAAHVRLEVGLAEVEVSSWNGLFAPAGTPQEIVAFPIDNLFAELKLKNFIIFLSLTRQSYRYEQYGFYFQKLYG